MPLSSSEVDSEGSQCMCGMSTIYMTIYRLQNVLMAFGLLGVNLACSGVVSMTIFRTATTVKLSELVQ